MSNKILIIFFIALLFYQLEGEEEESHYIVFENAKNHYSKGHYDSTISIIRNYLKKHGKENPTEFIVPLLMEALVRVNDFSYFNKLFNIYKRKFPNSKFLPRLYYLEGIVKAREKKYKKSIISFSNALKGGVNEELDSLTVLNVSLICDHSASLSELNSLARNKDIIPDIKEIVEYFEIVNLFESGQMANSNVLAQMFRKNYPKSNYISTIKKIISKSKDNTKQSASIGLLAPISGDNEDIGKYVVKGVQLAIDEYNSNSSSQIELIILDTRGNMVETARKTQEMNTIHKPSVIIGPILSSNATVAASALMNNEDVVMVTPTATDDGIARLGKNIFQMNVTLSILGKKIAKYAVNNLNIKEFAIIAPINDYGRILSESFRNEIEKNGGEILAEEFFDVGTNDFRMQFESLRSKLTDRKWELMGLNENSKTDDNPKERRKKALYLADSTIIIGGLFLPSESEDVVKLSSQVYFHRIQTQLLGSNGWHSNNTILEGKKYVNNSIFSTNFEINEQNEKWTSFFNSFKNKYKEDPDRIAAPLSYDAANLILKAMEQEENDAHSIIENLYKIQNYQGASGLISFDIDGENSEAAIMKISDKKFIRVQ
jgi:ABC-type branched-subunit amino acid transport system substrate-binding protein